MAAVGSAGATAGVSAAVAAAVAGAVWEALFWPLLSSAVLFCAVLLRDSGATEVAGGFAKARDSPPVVSMANMATARLMIAPSVARGCRAGHTTGVFSSTTGRFDPC